MIRNNRLCANLWLLTSLLGGSLVAHNASAEQQLAQLNPVDGRSQWEIFEGWRFVVTHRCREAPDLYGFWPDDAQCVGYLDAELSLEAPLSYSARESRRRRMRLRVLGGPQEGEEVRVSGQFGSSDELYQRAIELPDPVVSFGVFHYQLAEFHDRVEQDLLKSQANAQAEIDEKRSEIMHTVLLAVIACVFACIGLWCIFRVARRILPRIGSRIKKWLGVGANTARVTLFGLRGLHMRSIVRDEVIRAATRSSIETTRQERALLREEIERAINDGNLELAKSLTAVLRKLEGDPVSPS